jgi:hypothetical protein
MSRWRRRQSSRGLSDRAGFQRQGRERIFRRQDQHALGQYGEPLQIARIVEIADEHVVLLDRAGEDRRDDDRVGILIAVLGNGGDQRGLPADRIEEARRRSGARRQRRKSGRRRQRAKQCQAVRFEKMHLCSYRDVCSSLFS